MPGRDREVAHRDHQDLERHEVAGDEDDEQHEVAAKAVLGEREARHAGERDRADNRRHRDQHAVEDELGHARIGEHGRVVLDEPEFARPAPQVAAVEVVDRADRRQRDAEHRQQPDRKARVERGAVGEACGVRRASNGRWEHHAALPRQQPPEEEGDAAAHQREQHGRDRGRVAVAQAQERLLVHVVGEHVRAVVGPARRHDHDEVEAAQRAHHAHHRGDEGHGAQLRQHHVPEQRVIARAVEPRGFDQLGAHAGEPGEVEHHAIGGLRPKPRGDDGEDRPVLALERRDRPKPELRKQRIEEPELRVQEPGEDQADTTWLMTKGIRNSARTARMPRTV